MVMLDKRGSLFERDGEGKLLPVKAVVETLEDQPEIRFIPITKGELQKLINEGEGGNTTKQQDEEIIVKHCIEPSYNEEEVKFMKPPVMNGIVMAILSVSLGVTQTELKKQSVSSLIESDDFKKKV